MFRFPGPRWAVLISLGGALVAQAQQPRAPSAPASAVAATAPAAPDAAGDLSYRSAVEGYQSFADEKVVPWRDANENVGRIGGWREYAREAQGAMPAPGPAASRPATSGPAPAASMSAPAHTAPPAPRGQDPHAGHGRK